MRSATVHRMADWRLVFILPHRDGTVAFLATHAKGKGERRAHSQVFGRRGDAIAYARGLASDIGCELVGLESSDAGSGDTANG